MVTSISGPTKGWYNDEKGFREAIVEYYLVHGWNKHGIPLDETLKERGLDFVVGNLGELTQ